MNFTFVVNMDVNRTDKTISNTNVNMCEHKNKTVIKVKSDNLVDLSVKIYINAINAREALSNATKLIINKYFNNGYKI